eukprot:IDg13403t1
MSSGNLCELGTNVAICYPKAIYTRDKLCTQRESSRRIDFSYKAFSIGKFAFPRIVVYGLKALAAP